jgi:hypothetical protein
MTTIPEHWTEVAIKELVGRTITKVEYMPREAAESWDWHCVGLVLRLDDGSAVLLLADDEGNGPGALEVMHADEGDTTTKLPTIPLYLLDREWKKREV